MVDILNSIDFEESMTILDLSNESFDLYIPADNVSFIDMPRRRVEKYIRDEGQSLDGSEDED